MSTPDIIRMNISRAVTITSLAAIAHDINRSNGWWEDREELADSSPRAMIAVVLECIALAHTELSEGVEAVRKTPLAKWGDMTKDSLARELAGTVVRIMDLSEFLEIDLAEAIRCELMDNLNRGHRHGGKAA